MVLILLMILVMVVVTIPRMSRLDRDPRGSVDYLCEGWGHKMGQVSGKLWWHTQINCLG